MSKPVLMIHHITEEMFSLPLEDYVLTFDDGTIDHYDYHKRFNQIKTQKIYFISSNKIGEKNYMSLNQIKELLLDENTTIGGHSHDHTRLDNMSLVECVKHIENDTKLMINWFIKNLAFKPTTFCYPFNNDLNRVYTAILKKHGIIKFYGSERIPIEKLLRSQNQTENL